MKSRLIVFLFVFLPKAFLSRIFGRFADWRIPRFILNRIIRWYVPRFGVRMDEAEIPQGGFRTLDQFFTRIFRQGARPVDNRPMVVVSPVDARIDEFGEITGTRILQAKGIDYLLSELLPVANNNLFIDGTFVTLYLSPGEYHRIHSPLDGRISSMIYLPGKLYPVMELMVNGIRGLFSKNERLVSIISTPYGKCAVCKIGAMNVGKMSLSYEPLLTNTKAFRKKKEIIYPQGLQPHTHRGDELGIFHLGSTIVLLFEKDMVKLDALAKGQKVKMGQRLGLLQKHNL